MIHESVSTWAGSSSWEKWAGLTLSGFVIRAMIQSAHIDIHGRVQLVDWLLFEHLLYTHFVRTGSAARLGNSTN